MGDLIQPHRQLGPIVKLTKFAVDDGPHNSDGLLLHGWDGDQHVTGFISRRVMDDWVDPRQPYRGQKSLYREQHNALGRRNLAAIERIVTSKYPFVDVLLSDITESGNVLDTSELVREPPPPSFQRMSRKVGVDGRALQ
jgi:hypothetical protein